MILKGKSFDRIATRNATTDNSLQLYNIILELNLRSVRSSVVGTDHGRDCETDPERDPGLVRDSRADISDGKNSPDLEASDGDLKKL